MSMYYTVLLKYFCHQFFHKANTIVMNIINSKGGSAETPEPPSGYGPDDMWIILLDAVIITPPISVAAVNNSRSTSFTCLSPIGLNEGGIASILWLLNSVFLEDLNLNNVNSLFASGFGTLRFSRVRLDQDSTSVSCSVHFTSGRVENSNDSLLLVQGL